MSITMRVPRDAAAAVFSVAVLLIAGGAVSAADPTAQQIDSVIKSNLSAQPRAGWSIAIVHNGRTTYDKGFGDRDNGTPDRFIAKDSNYYGVPVMRAAAGRAASDARTIYAVGSVTKQFTAAAILLLAEQNRVRLDDAVSRYAPEFTNTALTIRVLLDQRSGLPDLNTLAFLQRVHPLTKRADGSIDDLQVSREIAKMPVHFAAGARFEYSNSNYFVLGTIVERVAHVPLGTFLESSFFAPLGLSRTAYARTASSDDVAIGYRTDEHNAVWRAYPWELAWLGGAGAMTSTVEDLARWDVALMARQVVRADSLAQMWHGLDAGRGQGSYAMGWVEDALGSHRYLWHNGEVGGFHALNVLFPDDKLAFSLLSNNQDAKPEYFVPRLAALYFPVTGLDRLLPRSAVVLIEASLAIAVGAFAVAIVALVTFKRFVIVGIVAAVAAFVIGFFIPTVMGYVAGGLVALIPTVGYLVAVRFIKRTARLKS